MSARAAARPRPGATTATAAAPGPAPAHPGRRRLVVAVLAALGVLAVGLVAASLLRAGGEGTRATDAPGAGALAWGGGTLTVGEVRLEVVLHPEGMPDSMMPDPLPEGAKRVLLEVQVVAGDEPVAYDVDRLRLDVPGAEPAAPLRGSLGAGDLPPGARVGGSALFQVPASATAATLEVEGLPGSLAVELPDAAAGGHGEHGQHGQHGEHGADHGRADRGDRAGRGARGGSGAAGDRG